MTSFPLFLILPCTYTMKHDHIYSTFFSSNFSQIPHYTLHAPTQFRVFYFFNNPLSSVSVPHMCMGMGLTTGAWEFHRWPFKANATTLSSYSLINPRSALSLNLACRPCFPTGFSVPLRHYPLCSLPDLPFFQRVNPGKTVEVEKRSS